MTTKRLTSIFILLLALYLLFTTTVVYIVMRENRVGHALISMGIGLIFFWILVAGTAMYVLRDRAKTFIQNIPLQWQVKFIIFGILLAMLEEVITTTMTNLAPLFGAKIGEVYITASANYFDVILHHSVIAFVPWFIAWAWILKRYDFSPFWVFLLFGLNGLFAESLSFGLQHLGEFALWIFVYGLMIYLPAYTIPAERGAQRPRLWHGLLALILPLVIGIPWALLIQFIFPNHPSIHFPPINL